MAGTIVLPLAADTRALEAEIRRALGKNYQLTGLGSRGFTQPLGKIKGQLGEFDKSLEASNARVIAFGASAGAIYALSTALRHTVKATIEVQKQLVDINVILGLSEKRLAGFGSKLFDVASGTGASFSAVANAATELSRQGLGAAETLKRTRDALILTRLSGLDAASSVNALTAVMNGFNDVMLDSTSIVNKMAAVDAAFAVSSADLAEALKRVGSTANTAGVGFDELISVVTAAQQVTARGGSVIGNSFKTIFTRMQRPRVLTVLASLGIAVKDAAGDIRPLMSILQELAKTYDTLRTSQQAQIAELMGGVFQVNILKASLGDLAKQNSVYSQALRVSVNATDEAIRRNKQLNETLSSQLNRTMNNLLRTGAAVGKLTLSPTIKKVSGGLNDLLEPGDQDGLNMGKKVGQGILKGIGSFLSGPGIAMITLVVLKLFDKLARFGADAMATMSGMNVAGSQTRVIQGQIVQLLAAQPALLKAIQSGAMSEAQAHKFILQMIQLETRELGAQAAVASRLAGMLGRSGVRIGGAGTMTLAQGFVPKFGKDKAPAVREANLASRLYNRSVGPGDTYGAKLNMGGRKVNVQLNKYEEHIKKKDTEKVFGRKAKGDVVIAGGGKARAQNIKDIKKQILARGMVPSFRSKGAQIGASNRRKGARFEASVAKQHGVKLSSVSNSPFDGKKNKTNAEIKNVNNLYGKRGAVATIGKSIRGRGPHDLKQGYLDSKNLGTMMLYHAARTKGVPQTVARAASGISAQDAGITENTSGKYGVDTFDVFRARVKPVQVAVSAAGTVPNFAKNPAQVRAQLQTGETRGLHDNHPAFMKDPSLRTMWHSLRQQKAAKVQAKAQGVAARKATEHAKPRLDVITPRNLDQPDISKPQVKAFGFSKEIPQAEKRFDGSFNTMYPKMIQGIARHMFFGLKNGEAMDKAFRVQGLDPSARGQVRGRVFESFIKGMATKIGDAPELGSEKIDLKGHQIRDEFGGLFTPGTPMTGAEIRAGDITSTKAGQKMGKAAGHVPSFFLGGLMNKAKDVGFSGKRGLRTGNPFFSKKKEKERDEHYSKTMKDFSFAGDVMKVGYISGVTGTRGLLKAVLKEKPRHVDAGQVVGPEVLKQLLSPRGLNVLKKAGVKELSGGISSESMAPHLQEARRMRPNFDQDIGYNSATGRFRKLLGMGTVPNFFGEKDMVGMKKSRREKVFDTLMSSSAIAKASGYIPSFQDFEKSRTAEVSGLMRHRGLSRADAESVVYAGQHRRINQNSAGLGVFNLLDEPGGPSNAFAGGHVPRFEDTSMGLGGGIGLGIGAFVFQLQFMKDAIDKATEGSSMGGLAEEAQNAQGEVDKLAGEIGQAEHEIRDMGKAAADLKAAKKEKRALGRGARKEEVTKARKGLSAEERRQAAADPRYSGTKRQREDQLAKEKLIKAEEDKMESAKERGGDTGHADRKEKRRENQRRKDDLAVKQQEATDKEMRSKEAKEKKAKQGKVQQIGGAMAFGAPMMGQMASSMLPESAHKAKASIESLSSGAAAAGAAMMMIPGPIGIGIGVAIGAFTAIGGIVKAFTTKMPALNKAAEMAGEKFTTTSDALGRYGTAFEKYMTGFKDVNTLPSALLKLTKDLKKALMEVPAAFRNQIMGAGSMADFGAIAAEIKSELQRGKKSAEFSRDTQKKTEGGQKWYWFDNENYKDADEGMRTPGSDPTAKGVGVSAATQETVNMDVATFTQTFKDIDAAMAIVSKSGSADDMINELERTGQIASSTAQSLRDMPADSLKLFMQTLREAGADFANVTAKINALKPVQAARQAQDIALKKQMEQVRAATNKMRRALFNYQKLAGRKIMFSQGIKEYEGHKGRMTQLGGAGQQVDRMSKFMGEETTARLKFEIDFAKQMEGQNEEFRKASEEAKANILDALMSEIKIPDMPDPAGGGRGAKGAEQLHAAKRNEMQGVADKFTKQILPLIAGLDPAGMKNAITTFINANKGQFRGIANIEFKLAEEAQKFKEAMARMSVDQLSAQKEMVQNFIVAAQERQDKRDLKAGGGISGFLNPKSMMKTWGAAMNAAEDMALAAEQGDTQAIGRNAIKLASTTMDLTGAVHDPKLFGAAQDLGIDAVADSLMTNNTQMAKHYEKVLANMKSNIGGRAMTPQEAKTVKTLEGAITAHKTAADPKRARAIAKKQVENKLQLEQMPANIAAMRKSLEAILQAIAAKGGIRVAATGAALAGAKNENTAQIQADLIKFSNAVKKATWEMLQLEVNQDKTRMAGDFKAQAVTSAAAAGGRTEIDNAKLLASMEPEVIISLIDSGQIAGYVGAAKAKSMKKDLKERRDQQKDQRDRINRENARPGGAAAVPVAGGGAGGAGGGAGGGGGGVGGGGVAGAGPAGAGGGIPAMAGGGGGAGGPAAGAFGAMGAGGVAGAVGGDCCDQLQAQLAGLRADLKAELAALGGVEHADAKAQQAAMKRVHATLIGGALGMAIGSKLAKAATKTNLRTAKDRVVAGAKGAKDWVKQKAESAKAKAQAAKGRFGRAFNQTKAMGGNFSGGGMATRLGGFAGRQAHNWQQGKGVAGAVRGAGQRVGGAVRGFGGGLARGYNQTKAMGGNFSGGGMGTRLGGFAGRQVHNWQQGKGVAGAVRGAGQRVGGAMKGFGGGLARGYNQTKAMGGNFSGGGMGTRLGGFAGRQVHNWQQGKGVAGAGGKMARWAGGQAKGFGGGLARGYNMTKGMGGKFKGGGLGTRLGGFAGRQAHNWKEGKGVAGKLGKAARWTGGKLSQAGGWAKGKAGNFGKKFMQGRSHSRGWGGAGRGGGAGAAFGRAYGDVEKTVKAVSKGDFKKAYKILGKRMNKMVTWTKKTPGRIGKFIERHGGARNIGKNVAKYVGGKFKSVGKFIAGKMPGGGGFGRGFKMTKAMGGNFSGGGMATRLGGFAGRQAHNWQQGKGVAGAVRGAGQRVGGAVRGFGGGLARGYNQTKAMGGNFSGGGMGTRLGGFAGRQAHNWQQGKGFAGGVKNAGIGAGQYMKGDWAQTKANWQSGKGVAGAGGRMARWAGGQAKGFGGGLARGYNQTKAMGGNFSGGGMGTRLGGFAGRQVHNWQQGKGVAGAVRGAGQRLGGAVKGFGGGLARGYNMTKGMGGSFSGGGVGTKVGGWAGRQVNNWNTGKGAMGKVGGWGRSQGITGRGMAGGGVGMLAGGVAGHYISKSASELRQQVMTGGAGGGKMSDEQIKEMGHLAGLVSKDFVTVTDAFGQSQVIYDGVDVLTTGTLTAGFALGSAATTFIAGGTAIAAAGGAAMVGLAAIPAAVGEIGSRYFKSKITGQGGASDYANAAGAGLSRTAGFAAAGMLVGGPVGAAAGAALAGVMNTYDLGKGAWNLGKEMEQFQGHVGKVKGAELGYNKKVFDAKVGAGGVHKKYASYEKAERDKVSRSNFEQQNRRVGFGWELIGQGGNKRGADTKKTKEAEARQRKEGAKLLGLVDKKGNLTEEAKKMSLGEMDRRVRSQKKQDFTTGAKKAQGKAIAAAKKENEYAVMHGMSGALQASGKPASEAGQGLIANILTLILKKLRGDKADLGVKKGGEMALAMTDPKQYAAYMSQQSSAAQMGAEKAQGDAKNWGGVHSAWQSGAGKNEGKMTKEIYHGKFKGMEAGEVGKDMAHLAKLQKEGGDITKDKTYLKYKKKGIKLSQTDLDIGAEWYKTMNAGEDKAGAGFRRGGQGDAQGQAVVNKLKDTDAQAQAKAEEIKERDRIAQQRLAAAQPGGVSSTTTTTTTTGPPAAGGAPAAGAPAQPPAPAVPPGTGTTPGIPAPVAAGVNAAGVTDPTYDPAAGLGNLEAFQSLGKGFDVTNKNMVKAEIDKLNNIQKGRKLTEAELKLRGDLARQFNRLLGANTTKPGTPVDMVGGQGAYAGKTKGEQVFNALNNRGAGAGQTSQFINPARLFEGMSKDDIAQNIGQLNAREQQQKLQGGKLSDKEEERRRQLLSRQNYLQNRQAPVYGRGGGMPAAPNMPRPNEGWGAQGGRAPFLGTGGPMAGQTTPGANLAGGTGRPPQLMTPLAPGSRGRDNTMQVIPIPQRPVPTGISGRPGAGVPIDPNTGQPMTTVPTTGARPGSPATPPTTTTPTTPPSTTTTTTPTTPPATDSTTADNTDATNGESDATTTNTTAVVDNTTATTESGARQADVAVQLSHLNTNLETFSTDIQNLNFDTLQTSVNKLQGSVERLADATEGDDDAGSQTMDVTFGEELAVNISFTDAVRITGGSELDSWLKNKIEDKVMEKINLDNNGQNTNSPQQYA